MTDNPYLPAAPTAVENAESRTTEVLDPLIGSQSPIGGAASIVTLDPTGGRVFVDRNVLVRSTDGRLLKGQAFVCRCGCSTTSVYAPEAMLACAFCQTMILRAHAKTWNDGQSQHPVCPGCWEHGHRWRAVLRFLRWLTRI